MVNLILPFQRERVPIPLLIRKVLEFIYDRKNCLHSHQEIQRFIMEWFDWVNREKDRVKKLQGSEYVEDTRVVGTKGTIVDEVEFWIQWCSLRLVWDEENTGEVARNKRDIILHGLSWKKLYRLKEAYTPGDFAKAMAYLKRAQNENPEDYGRG